jgi:hypothetical protein
MHLQKHELVGKGDCDCTEEAGGMSVYDGYAFHVHITASKFRDEVMDESVRFDEVLRYPLC